MSDAPPPVPGDHEYPYPYRPTEQYPSPQSYWSQPNPYQPYPPQHQPQPPAVIYVAPPATNGLATGAMVTGIASVPLLCCCYLGLVTGAVAIILGAIAYHRANQIGGEGRSYAIVAMATGVAPFIVLVLLAILGGVSHVFVPGGVAPTP